MIPRPRALLIDGTAGLYRGYFAIRSLIGRDGSQVNAVYGFTQELLALLREWEPEYAAAAFDVPGTPTFRHRQFPEYKRGRPAMPERLVLQLEPGRSAARALGITAVSLAGWEADDLLATLVRRLRARGVACLVVGADKDLAQLVGPGVWLLTPGSGEPVDAGAVRSRYGVPPERIADLLALRGDEADGIRGVPGIGERAALRLLSAPRLPGDVQCSPSDLDGLGLPNPQAAAAALRAGRGIFQRNRALTALRDDVPLEITDASLVYRGVATDAVRSMGKQLGFDRLVSDILEFASVGDRGQPPG